MIKTGFYGWRRHLVTAITLMACTALRAELFTDGYGVYEEFGAPLYAVKLESKQRLKNATELLTENQEKQLTLRVLAQNVDRRQWCRFWTHNIAINMDSQHLEMLADSLLMVCDHVAGNLQRGDEIVFFRHSSSVTEFQVNQIVFGLLEGEGIFEAFLSPFLGPSPVSNDLKYSLLHQVDTNSTEALAYRQSILLSERIADVRNWVTKTESPVLDVPEKIHAQSSSVLHIIEEFDNAEEDTGDSSVSAEEISSAPSPYEYSNGNKQQLMMASVAFTESDTELAKVQPGELLPHPRENLPRISLMDIQEYQRQSLRQVYEHLEYPLIAQRRGREGMLRVTVDIDQKGEIQGIHFLERAKYDEFNAAAQVAVEQSAPFPTPPLDENEEFFSLLLPIRFTLE